MQSTERVTIQAPVELVWRILTDIDSWPRWQSAVSNASLSGTLVPNTTFKWTAGGMPIKSRITSVTPPFSIAWEGETYGTKAIHQWQLSTTDGATLVETSETMSGWLVRLLGLFDQKFLENALKKTLGELKQEAERQHVD